MQTLDPLEAASRWQNVALAMMQIGVIAPRATIYSREVRQQFEGHQQLRVLQHEQKSDFQVNLVHLQISGSEVGLETDNIAIQGLRCYRGDLFSCALEGVIAANCIAKCRNARGKGVVRTNFGIWCFITAVLLEKSLWNTAT